MSTNYSGVKSQKIYFRLSGNLMVPWMDGELYFSYRFLGLKSQKDPLKGLIPEESLFLYGYALHIGLLTEQLFPKQNYSNRRMLVSSGK